MHGLCGLGEMEGQWEGKLCYLPMEARIATRCQKILIFHFLKTKTQYLPDCQILTCFLTHDTQLHLFLAVQLQSLFGTNHSIYLFYLFFYDIQVYFAICSDAFSRMEC
jgi:hypothetical protein